MTIDRKTICETSPDVRINAAVDHAKSHATIDRITGIRKQLLADKGFEWFMDRADTSSFLSGYDFAMKLRAGELLAENHELHTRLFEVQWEAGGFDDVKQKG